MSPWRKRCPLGYDNTRHVFIIIDFDFRALRIQEDGEYILRCYLIILNTVKAQFIIFSNMSETAITVENISKCYRIGVRENLSDTFFGEVINFIKSPYRNYQRLRNLSNFSDIGNNDKDILWALKNVSFEVKQGDVFGIVGKNGAGKSTMLKILSRIVEPTSGQALIKGKVSSLLEVGTGFHPELTGRENIYLNGTIMGMSKSEINRNFDEIAEILFTRIFEKYEEEVIAALVLFSEPGNVSDEQSNAKRPVMKTLSPVPMPHHCARQARQSRQKQVDLWAAPRNLETL